MWTPYGIKLPKKARVAKDKEDTKPLKKSKSTTKSTKKEAKK